MAEIPPTFPARPAVASLPTSAASSVSRADSEPQAQTSLGAVATRLAILATILATLAFFFGYLRPFTNGLESVAVWAMKSWNEENELDHGPLVPLIAIGLVYYHWDELRKAAKNGSNFGAVWLFIGILLFVLSIRCIQPRLALMSVPFLIYGSVGFVSGLAAARIILFPCAFLIFMIPVAALQQATFKLQFIITGLVGVAAHLFGIGIQAVGTTLTASDGSFNFEIAEGCSGIRSLAAMTMLTAIYVHLTQDRQWKKIVIILCSFGFAIVGNVGRIFSIVLVAKYYDKDFAAGLYHHYSGYLSFPAALLALVLFSKLVNVKFGEVQVAAASIASKAMVEEKKPVKYDY